MAIVSAHGLSPASATNLAQSNQTHEGQGLSTPLATMLAASTMIHSGHGLCEAVSANYGAIYDEVVVTSILAVDSTTIRVTFDKGVLKNTELYDVSNYQITPQSAGAVGLYLIEITPENINHPTFVDISTSEMTDGATYEGVVSSNITDPSGAPVDGDNNSDTFLGIGDIPTILMLEPISANRVDVVFSENMKNNADILNPAKYTFDNGLNVLSVLELEEDTVKLVTDDQVPGVVYTLTVNP